MRNLAPMFLLLFFYLCASPKLVAAAIDDIKLEISTETCKGGSTPANESFNVYASNTNQNARISANFKYDTSPSGQAFSLFDSDLMPFTEQFPKYEERRLAPGERAMIGCTVNYRSSPNPKSVTAVPILITTAGAVYVDPSKPYPPAEDGKSFVAFFPQLGFSACEGGGRKAGLLMVGNLHPFKTLSVTVELSGNLRGPFQVTLMPLMFTRIACSNGQGSPVRVTNAEFK